MIKKIIFWSILSVVVTIVGMLTIIANAIDRLTGYAGDALAHLEAWAFDFKADSWKHVAEKDAQANLEQFGWRSKCTSCGQTFSANEHNHTFVHKGLTFEAYQCRQCQTINSLTFEIAPVPFSIEEITFNEDSTPPVHTNGIQPC